MFTELWSIALILCLCIIIFSCRGYLRMVLLSLQLSGPLPVPLLGNCLLITEKDVLQNRFATAYNLYGSVVRIWVLFFPFFVVLQPDDLQIILSSQKHTSKVFFYRLLHNFLGNGLITSNGTKWSTHRRLIQPAFHLNTLEKFISTFVDASQAMLENLLDDISRVGEINIAKYVNECVINILNEAVLGVPVKRNRSCSTIDMEQSPFRRGKVVVTQRFIQPWLLLDTIYHMTKLAADELDQKKRLDQFTRQMIQRRRALLANCADCIEPKCLLDYMIDIADKNHDFSEDDIVNEACTFMLAGQDSVGAGIAFTIFLLAQHTRAQQLCHQELERIFGDDKQRVPSKTDLRNMRYIEMCIKEALRLYPSVPLMARKLGEDVRLKKCTLPAGSNVFISPYATHRLSHIYPEPEEFNPERFSSEHSERRHPYAFIPFSAGPRYCIGNRFALMEMKTVVSRVLRSFQILPVPGKTTFEAKFRITVRASGGLWVRLEPKRVKSE